MQYKDKIQRILDIKSLEWDECFNKLLHNYKFYYSDDISLEDKLEMKSGESIVKFYDYKIKSEFTISLIKKFFGSESVITDGLNTSYHRVTSIPISFIFNKKDTNILKIKARQSHSWYQFKTVVNSKKINWVGSYKIFIKEKKSPKWFPYNWLLTIDTKNNYKDLNNYEIYKRKEFYNVLTGNELTNMLKVAKLYLDQTVLYDLLLSQELLWMTTNNTSIPYRYFYVAIPGSQIKWRDYELIWVLNFYL